MIDGLIAGKLYGTPSIKTGASGKTFVTAKVRAAAGDGESLFVNIITFSESVGAALLALDEGDSVALTGPLTLRVWIDRNGDAKPSLDMVAHCVMSPYHLKRKRVAVAHAFDQKPGPEPQGNAKASQKHGDGMAESDALFGGDTALARNLLDDL